MMSGEKLGQRSSVNIAEEKSKDNLTGKERVMKNTVLLNVKDWLRESGSDLNARYAVNSVNCLNLILIGISIILAQKDVLQ